MLSARANITDQCHVQLKIKMNLRTSMSTETSFLRLFSVARLACVS